MLVFLKRAGSSILSFFGIVLGAIVFQIIDIAITLANLFTPSLGPKAVVPAGRPGAGGIWPEYHPPTEKDSR